MRRSTSTRLRPAFRTFTAIAAAALGAGLAAAAPTASADASTGCADYPFRDPSRPMSARVHDLVGRLTLTEKISLLHQYEAPIPRLCIGLFKAGTEALHGVAWSNDFNDN